MSSRKRPTAAPLAEDDYDNLFEGIGDDKTPAKPSKTKPAVSAPKGKPGGAEEDILAELENQLVDEKPSRPHTPRVRETGPKGAAIKRTSTNTPPPDRVSEDKQEKTTVPIRKSGESNRSYRASFTPSATSSEPQEGEKKEQPAANAANTGSTGGGGGGGWWGSVLASATAAIKQAEVAVKEIQQNEEAKKWAEHVRGNVGSLKGLGDELRHRALPTFTNILHTLAPPIASHERLLIHITHDIAGYPSLDPLVYGVFSRVMSQVEGGDLLVIQRGQESTIRSPSAGSGSDRPGGSFFAGIQSTAGWHDGPWWRQTDSPRDLGVVKGLREGTKLCRASAEAYAHDYFASHGGVEVARQRALEPVSQSNPVRSSDLFLAVQAVAVDADTSLFVGSSADEKEKETSPVMDTEEAEEMVCFAVFVLDPVHEIHFSSVSQAIPSRWIHWLDAPAPLTPASGDEGAVPQSERVPDEIREIVESGGVDPREWVAEWVEEALSLAVGVVAQRYVARRMGVGEGGIGKGKQKIEEVVQEGGGEAARAGVL
ncbi:hypothetical protein VTK73DRAFT_8201 [Phialemonium thermophilum]|uniref:Maintenance of telomere capping protein 1 n=1 Tax=Phialemonium thermophilum TaxID=223376 RepID=A0ABR3W9R2_9PEZI